VRKKSTANAKKANVPRVGLFFVVNGKPIVDGLPWTAVPSLAGFRTFALGHPEFWARLQQAGVVPQGMPYEDCPRGRVNRFDATGRFTLLADRCIIRSKTLVREIMAALRLPRGTRVATDSHYKCAVCMGKVPTRKQEAEDWDF
jgi:hypothetical protein